MLLGHLDCSSYRTSCTKKCVVPGATTIIHFRITDLQNPPFPYSSHIVLNLKSYIVKVPFIEYTRRSHSSIVRVVDAPMVMTITKPKRRLHHLKHN